MSISKYATLQPLTFPYSPNEISEWIETLGSLHYSNCMHETWDIHIYEEDDNKLENEKKKKKKIKDIQKMEQITRAHP